VCRLTSPDDVKEPTDLCCLNEVGDVWQACCCCFNTSQPAAEVQNKTGVSTDGTPRQGEHPQSEQQIGTALFAFLRALQFVAMCQSLNVGATTWGTSCLHKKLLLVPHLCCLETV
jgi:hypothetical protein